MSIGVCPLSDLADIKLGVKTFLNDYFYVDKDRIAQFGIEKRFLEPVFRTGDLARDRFIQKSASTKLQIFRCSTDVSKLVGTGAAAYIKWAGKQRHSGTPNQPGGLWKDTPAATPGNHVWYQNQAMPPAARIVLLKAFDEYFAPVIIDKAIRVDQRFNQVNAKPGIDEDILIGLLCSMWFVMTCETLGATAMGQGALEVRTEVLRDLLLPDIRKLSSPQKKAWIKATQGLLEGPRLTAAKARDNPKQHVLDALVLKTLNLGSSRLDELYEDTLRMGQVRRLLAAGRGAMRREQFASDVEHVAEDVAAQLRPLVQGRRFPQDFLPDSARLQTVQLGDTPLLVRAEHMLGQRHVKITSDGQTVYEETLPASTGELLVRAIQWGQRVVPIPEEEVAANAALLNLRTLITQLDAKLNELGATAGNQAQGPLRDQAEANLNVPVRLLLADLADVYEALH